MAEKNIKPEIRFKGFTEDWEEKKYSETFKKIPNNTLSRAELNYNYGRAKNVHYGDVLIKFGELLDVEKDEIPYITNEAFVNKFKPSKLQNGDVIIADAAEDETVGKCTELVNVGEEIIFSGLHTIPSRPTLSFASGYLGYFMNSPAYHTQLLRLMQGTKVLSISKTVLQDTAIIYPIDNLEQSKIGTYFNNLDHLITLNQHKYNKLATIKKSMLVKMFPQNGAVVPEIRFKGFTEAWEERKLEEVVDFSRGRGLCKNDIVSGGKHECVLYGNLYTDYGMVIKNINYSTNKYSYEMTISQYGDVLIPCSDTTPTGLARATCIEKSGVILGGDINILRPKQPLVGSFLSYNINSIRSKLIKLIKGSTVRHLDNSDLKNVEILIPKNPNEQEKISGAFKSLDNLITLHQLELEKLKNIKKACLEKMFV